MVYGENAAVAASGNREAGHGEQGAKAYQGRTSYALPLEYRTHIFDCDGVLLDSNRIKEEAFYEVALPFGAEAAERLVSYHRVAGATGRGSRVDHLFHNILELEECDTTTFAKQEFTAQVTKLIVARLEACRLVEGVRPYLEWLRSCKATLAVLSGIETVELTGLLERHSLLDYFSSVQGTSDKLASLYAMTKAKGFERPAVYYGDTQDDWTASLSAGIDRFVLVYGASTDPTIKACRTFLEMR